MRASGKRRPRQPDRMTGAGAETGPRHILFGHYPSWTARIAERIDHGRFVPSFSDFVRSDPDAFDAAVPTRIEHYDQLRGRGRAIVPKAKAVELCEDKLALRDALRSLGFGDSLPEDVEGPGDYPCVLKPRRGEFGADIRVLKAPEAVPDGYYLERFVTGATEYAFHLLRAGGRTAYHQAIRYEMAEPEAIRSDANPPKTARLVDGAALLDWAERLLDAIGFEGLCCLNFKLVERQPRLFEINPRFGGSLVFDITRFTGAYCDALDAIRQD